MISLRNPLYIGFVTPTIWRCCINGEIAWTSFATSTNWRVLAGCVAENEGSCDLRDTACYACQQQKTAMAMSCRESRNSIKGGWNAPSSAMTFIVVGEHCRPVVPRSTSLAARVIVPGVSHNNVSFQAAQARSQVREAEQKAPQPTPPHDDRRKEERVLQLDLHTCNVPIQTRAKRRIYLCTCTAASSRSTIGYHRPDVTVHAEDCVIAIITSFILHIFRKLEGL